MSIEQTLQDIGQVHLLDTLRQLPLEKQHTFRKHLEMLDWDTIELLIRNHILSEAVHAIPAALSPAPYFPIKPETPEQAAYYDRARQEGNAVIRAGKVAAFTVAGGQGSRLGFDGPKGLFPISPVKQKSLFQIFSEKIQFSSKQHGVVIPWYIMTSSTNHADTCTFFEEHNYFGMAPADVSFFIQGELPAFTPEGKLILAGPDRLFMSPDGHGGSLKALVASGAVDDMTRRGIDYLSYFQVDNPLVTIIDPLFIGLHHLEKSDVSSKMIPKIDADEKMGVFCTANDRLQIIEYSDLPEALATATDHSGRLRYIAGSPAVHIFNIDFIKKLNNGSLALPIHLAQKTIPSCRITDGAVEPIDVNGIKLETFVFDALTLADRSIILESERAAEFAPVKNAAGDDSPESCQQMMMNLFATWLKKRGVSVPETAKGELLCKLEISPLAAATEADMATLTLPSRIEPQEEVYLL